MKKIKYSFIFLILSTKYVEAQTAVFVVAPARSGTSAVAGLLQILGVNLGTNLFGPNEFNTKGHFENIALVKQGVPFLEKFNSDSWLVSYPTYQRNDYIDYDIMVKQIRSVMLEEFRDSSLIGFKWSPLSLLLPIFIEAAESLGYTPKIIVVIRDPLKIVDSWKKRWPHYKKEEVLLSIANNYCNILRSINGYDVLSIEYDKLLSNPKNEILKLQAFLPEAKKYKDAKKEIMGFLNKDLRHF